MTDNGDLKVGKETLRQLTDGINAAIDELQDSGASATESVMGSGFDGLTLTHKEAGHGGLADDFEDFCERWEWGVRDLMYNANRIAAALDLSAGLFYAEERYWEDTFKYAAHVANPTSNPGLSPEEVAQQDWGQVLTPDGPDLSVASMRDARQSLDDAWRRPPSAVTPTQTSAEGER